MNKDRRPITLVLLMAALGAAFAPLTGAVTLNPKGLGQVLVYPYYTVNASQDTLISIVNTSSVGKMVALRFDEGMNGRPVLDSTLYLSPTDVWTARVSQADGSAGAVLFTSDRSCIVPSIPAAGQPFDTSGYDGSGALPADVGPTGTARTREGMLTVIALGDIIAGSALDTATTHVQNGEPGAGVAPCTPSVLENNSSADVIAPTSGLFGTASIVNVGEGTVYGYNATALTGFTDVALTAFAVSQTYPTLASANSSAALDGGALAELTFDDGTELSLDYANPIDAVSAVFMADSIFNEYLVGGGLGANTDWIVAFPTKAFYVDPYYGTVPRQPFVEAFGDSTAGGSNVTLGMTAYDREEGTPQVCGEQCPPPPLLAPGYEVNVVSFVDPASTAPTGVVGSGLASSVPTWGTSGWAVFDLVSGDGGHLLGADRSRHIIGGLPVAGFMIYNVINSNAAPGRLANYGGAIPHRSTLGTCNIYSTGMSCS